MRLCNPLPANLSDEQLLAIAQADWMRNYSKSPHTVEELLRALYDWLRDGLPIGYFEGVIFIGRWTGEGTFEFHSMNGASIRTLLRGTRQLLQDLKEQGVVYASTYFNEFRVADLAKHFAFPAATDYSPYRPEERKFCTTFYLGN